MKHFIPFVFLSLMFAGCGGTVSVSGTVTMEGGDPVSRGYISFNNGSYETRAMLREDGSYIVDTDGRGMQKGEYRVFFTATEGYELVPTPGSSTPTSVRIPLIDDKYSSLETTDLTVNIDRSTVYSPVLIPAPKK